MANNQSQINKKMLERGYWVATHRIAIQRGFTMSLYGLIILVYLIFFVQFGIYMFTADQWNQFVYQSIQPTVDWELVHSANQPAMPEVGSINVFSRGDNRFDYIIEVYNGNPQWAVEEVTLSLQLSNGETVEGITGFILPKQRRFITAYDIQATERVNSAAVSIDSIRWKKLSRLPELSWIYLEEPTYSGRQVVVVDGEEKSLPPKIRWTVQNGSTLNIREVVWQVALYRGGQLERLVEYTAENMEFLKERDFEITLDPSTPRIDDIVIYPIVNILDPNFTYIE